MLDIYFVHIIVCILNKMSKRLRKYMKFLRHVPIQVSSMTLNLPAPQKVLGSKIEVALKPLVGPKDFQLGTFFHKHRTVRPLAGRRGGQCDPLILTRLFLKATRFFI